MLRIIKVTALSLSMMFAICALCALPSHAGGGGSSDQPKFQLIIQGLAGFEGLTSSYLTGLVQPPFYNEGEGNVSYVAPAHSDYFTTAYWLKDDQKLSTQAHSQFNLAGDMQYEGMVEVGANDTRPYQVFNLYVNNYNSDLTWWVQMYRKDTHRLVFREKVEAHSSNNCFYYMVPTSRQGYDILAAAWIETPDMPTVPEPGSLATVSGGLLGFVAFLRRKAARLGS